MQQITIQALDPSKRRPKPADESKLIFGRIFSDHMLQMDWLEGKGWQDAEIVPYKPFQMDPAAMVLHYGQGIFEGLKAYRWPDNTIHLFRPYKNWVRWNKSAEHLCLPTIDPDFHQKMVESLIRLDRSWVPHTRGSSLYIRPTMIASEPHLGVRPAHQVLYFLLTGPVAAYYAEGFNPVSIYVSDEFVRATKGGLGEAKTMANYASSLYAAEVAKKKGFTQVLWLDAVERRWIEEVGTMNIFFKIKDEVVTPALSGSILAGVTRDSVIQLAKHWGYTVSERSISIEEVIDAAKSGDLKEMFGTGTAAVISPVGSLSYKGESFTVQDGSVGELSHRLFDEITGIQYGERPDPFNWMVTLDV